MADKSDKKKKLSVVIIGHVDSGKSTTTGHLIYLSGGADKRVMEKLEKEAAERGKESFKYAYLLDKTNKERDRGITIDITQIAINTPHSCVTVIDAPGHRDFLKNMITGASVADVAILVLPAAKGEFEVAMSPEGSAREHATLAFTMGVKVLLVAVNKMDLIAKEERQARFNEITTEATNICRKIGFKVPQIAFIPISGYHGWNLYAVSDEMPWFKEWKYEVQHPTQGTTKITGKTIFEWCDTLLEPNRPLDKSLRIVVDCAYKIGGIGTVATGRVETGILKPGDVIHACPAGFSTEVKSIEMHHLALDQAIPGDSIGFNLKNIPVSDIRRGNVVGHAAKDPPRQCVHFVAHTMVLAATGSKDKGFRKGFAPVCDAHTAHFQVHVDSVQYKLDKRTGKKIEDLDEATLSFLKSGEVGFVKFVPNQPVCLEAFSDFPPLGRMAVREAKKTIGVCVIKEIVKEEAPVGKGAGGKGGAAKGAAAKAGGAKGKK